MHRLAKVETLGVAAFFGAAMVLLPTFATATGSEEIQGARLHERGFVLVTPPVVTAERCTASRPCRTDAAAGGDFNGDGFDDFVAVWVNPSPDAEPALHEAVALLVYGGDSRTGRYQLEEIDAESVRFIPGAPLVNRVRAGFVGDLNGDGRSELALSFNDTADPGPESSFIVFGQDGLTGEVPVPAPGLQVVEITTTDPGIDDVGWMIAAVGDVNGDGRSDIGLSSPRQGRQGLGFVFVVYGFEQWQATVDLAEVGTTVAGFVLRGRREDAAGRDYAAPLGQGMGATGDINGDGFDDFCLTGGSRVYIVLGAPEREAMVDLAEDAPDGIIEIRGERKRDPVTTVKFPVTTTQGVSVGDMNGDGLDDFLLALSVKEFLSWDDQTVLVFGRRDFPAKIDLAEPLPFPSVTFHTRDRPGLEHDWFGNHFAPAGDVNRDGLPDLLVGAKGTAVDGRSDVGRGYVIYGRTDWETDVFLSQGFDGIRVSGEELSDAFGSIVEPAGDFNGDGNPDLLFVAPEIGDSVLLGTGAPSNPEKIRRFYVLFGSGGAEAELAIHAVEPAWGRARGGEQVVIRGSGFVEGVTVRFGEAVAEILELSTTSLRVLVPAGVAEQTVDVVVSLGERIETLPAAFQYTHDFPELSLEPAEGAGFALVTPEPESPSITSILGAAFADLDGDGADELVIGMRGDTLGEESPPWAVTIVPGGIRPAGELPLGGAGDGGLLLTTRSTDVPVAGANVESLGDVDGDGLEDLGIGVSAARAYLLFGRSVLSRERILIEDEIAAGRAVELEGTPEDIPDDAIVLHARFAAVGDLSGDGIAEFAVSQSGPLAGPEFRPGEIVFLEGRARAEWPSAVSIGPESGEGKRIVGSLDEGLLGYDLRSAGDVDGDGWSDLLALADREREHGVFYVIFGHAWDDMRTTADILDLVRSGSAVRYALREGLSQAASMTLAAPGDVNGDGYADFLAGVLGGGEVHSIFTGFNYLFLGSSDLAGGQVFEDPSEPEDGIVRIAGDIGRMQAAGVSAVGDYDADGLDDFAISFAGKFSETGPVPPAGFYLFFGREEFPERIELGDLGSWGLRVENRTRPSPLMPLLRNAGDFDGDGVDDLVIGEARGRFDVGNFDAIQAGRVSVIYGQAEGQPFVRGDCDGDGQVSGSVTDVVSLLAFAFAGGESPPCLAACDVDANGAVEGTTDAIYLLSYTFLGGEPPPAPFPRCGIGKVRAGALGCEAYPRCGR